MKMITKTRKRHICRKCKKWIPKGSRAMRMDSEVPTETGWRHEYEHVACKRKGG